MERVELSLDSVWSCCTTIMLHYHIETHLDRFPIGGGDLASTLELYSSQMCFYMVGRIGFEPMTNRLKVYCSTNWANVPSSYHSCHLSWQISFLKFGSQWWERSIDPRLIKTMLYHWANWLFGGGDKDRTCYILLAKQALSQMSYTPKYYGSRAWARTTDILINSQTLLPTELHGNKLGGEYRNRTYPPVTQWQFSKLLP